jgi:hypothetical protein
LEPAPGDRPRAFSIRTAISISQSLSSGGAEPDPLAPMSAIADHAHAGAPAQNILKFSAIAKVEVRENSPLHGKN